MNDQEYKTSDLCLASTLYTLGVKLLRMDRSNLSRCAFVFQATAILDDILEKWQTGSVQVPVRQYHQNTRTLRTMTNDAVGRIDDHPSFRYEEKTGGSTKEDYPRR